MPLNAQVAPPFNAEVTQSENDYITRDRAIDLANKAFESVVPNYRADKDRLGAALADFFQQIQDREAAGYNTTIADQMAREAGWLVKYTADFKRAEARIDALRNVLAGPLAKEPPPQDDDGSWGPGCT